MAACRSWPGCERNRGCVGTDCAFRDYITPARCLDYALDPQSGFDHLVLTTDAIIKAAEFWAFLGQSRIPTASPDALDADAILAGQAALACHPGDTVTIATTNLAHLNRFPGIDAQIWDKIP